MLFGKKKKEMTQEERILEMAKNTAKFAKQQTARIEAIQKELDALTKESNEWIKRQYELID